ncbi:MAG TPA: hypothetical protein VEB86_18440 [Chryseosolibacter sp.]|nr:hypothetical protein [Chryseosolibacter sp.]
MSGHILPRRAIFICCVLTTFLRPGSSAQAPKIYGHWSNKEFGFEMVLILQENGTGEFDGDPINFRISGSRLTMVHQGASNTYDFQLEGNSLTISGGDFEAPIVFSRAGANTGNAAATAIIESTKSIPENLIGAWSGYNEKIEFRGNGECLFQGQTFRYSVSANKIKLETGNGLLEMPYSITGNQIQFIINGQSFTYIRTTKSEKVTDPPTRSKKIDGALVGKWCYISVNSISTGGSSTSECVILNQDGTYEYSSESSRTVNTPDLSAGTASQSSDRGTWWIEGDRIFYNSESQGIGSYQLGKVNHPKTGDPMIVLDGRSFVTFFQRNPW